MTEPKRISKSPKKSFTRGALPAALLLAMPGVHASSQRSSTSRRGSKAATTVQQTEHPAVAENPFAGFSTNRALQSRLPVLQKQQNVLGQLAARGLLNSQGRSQSRLSGDIQKRKGGNAKGGSSVVSCATGATYSGVGVDNYRFYYYPGTYLPGTYICSFYTTSYIACYTGTYIPGTSFPPSSSCSLTNTMGQVAFTNSNPGQCAAFLAACTTPAGDTTPPTPVISGPVATQTGAFNITIDFAEDVTGFVVGDISVGNGAATGLMDNGGGNFTVTITPAADGPVTVDVNAMVAADLAGNDNLVAMQYSVQADITAPTPVISGPMTTQNAAFNISIDFAEAVSGFVLGDISVSNGGATNLVDNGGGSFTVTITPAADGAVTVDVNAAVAADTAGNSNLMAAQFSVLADITAPTPVISGPMTTQNAAFNITIDFAEAVTGFVVGDISVGNGSATNLVDNGGGNFTVTITPAAGGTVTVDVNAAVAADGVGNNNLAAMQFSVLADISAPTPVFIDPGLTQVGGPFMLQIDFGEVVTGFMLGDIMVTNGTATNLVDLGGGLFEVTITPSGSAGITVNVPAGAAQDGAANPSGAMAPFVLGPAAAAVPIPVTGGWLSVLMAGLLSLFGFSRLGRKKNRRQT